MQPQRGGKPEVEGRFGESDVVLEVPQELVHLLDHPFPLEDPVEPRRDSSIALFRNRVVVEGIVEQIRHRVRLREGGTSRGEERPGKREERL